MESSERYKVLLNHLDWNIRHLKEILKNPKTVYYRDASIQRFGFTFDLALKCLKSRLGSEGKVCAETEDWFLAAEEKGYVSEAGDWKLAVEDYRLIKDGFHDSEGETVYGNLTAHLAFFERLHNKLGELTEKSNPEEPANDSLGEIRQDV